MIPTPPEQTPLLVLVADLDIENAVLGLLSRHQSLGIRELKPLKDFEILRHPNRDGGCRTSADVYLSHLSKNYERVIVLFDHDGCGQEDLSRETIEADLEQRLSRNGWANRNAVVCIQPELEAWVWSTSPQVPEKLGWHKQETKFREWLVGKGFLESGKPKPKHPKEALAAVLRKVGRSPSASIFKELAESVSLRHCTDSAFAKLKTILQQWFPAPSPND